jgi:hypothetical protein
MQNSACYPCRVPQRPRTASTLPWQPAHPGVGMGCAGQLIGHDALRTNALPSPLTYKMRRFMFVLRTKLQPLGLKVARKNEEEVEKGFGVGGGPVCARSALSGVRASLNARRMPLAARQLFVL